MEDLVKPFPTRDFWHGKRVLLTGHTGFKGTWCALWLERLGAEVIGLSLAPQTEPDLWTRVGQPGGSSLGDIRDAKIVAEHVERASPAIVLHMAAQALVQPSYIDPADTFSTNVMGLVNVLDAARHCATVKAVVNVTSDKCYENTEQMWAYRENEPMGGSDPYSASKGCAELITASYRRSFFNRPDGPGLGSGRAGNVIGGGDWSGDRLLPDCIRAFTDGQPVIIRNPLATRPWQHVLEPVCGYLMLAEALFTGGHAFAKGWNFGPDDSGAWGVGRVVNHAVARWGDGARWERDSASWPKEAMLLRVDATKARRELRWRPQLSVAEALDWTVDWYKERLAGASERDLTLDQITRYEDLLRASSLETS